LNLKPSAEDIHIMLLRARQTVLLSQDQDLIDDYQDQILTDYSYALGVLKTLEWLIGDALEPLTSETDWLPIP